MVSGPFPPPPPAAYRSWQSKTNSRYSSTCLYDIQSQRESRSLDSLYLMNELLAMATRGEGWITSVRGLDFFHRQKRVVGTSDWIVNQNSCSLPFSLSNAVDDIPKPHPELTNYFQATEQVPHLPKVLLIWLFIYWGFPPPILAYSGLLLVFHHL